MMSNNYLIDTKKLQFEISSMCNALCLGCVRTETSNYNDKKSLIPPNVYLKFETFQKIITDKNFESVSTLEFCGTIDDPLMHPDFLDFLKFAADFKKFKFIIHTNGSLRNKSYWKSLAEILKDTDHRILFSLDGLEDTNHIYRQNTSWKKIIENAETFLENGGYAAWQYLIFSWNKHQIDQAQELSIKLGFKEFMSRHDRSGISELPLQFIKEKKHINQTHSKITDLETVNTTLSKLVKNPIECNNQNQKMFFISFDSRLWPCCFLHNGLLSTDTGKREILEKRLFESYGKEWNNCETRSIEDILSHDFYKNDLVESWKSEIHGINTIDRIFRCTEVCNIETLKVLPIGGAKLLYQEKI